LTLLNVKVNRENFRDRMNFTNIFNTICDIESRIMGMCKPQTIFTAAGDMEVVLVSPDTAVLAAFKVVLDSNWRKMAKVLPDLKPVDQHALLGQEIEEEEELPIMDLVEFKKRLRVKLLADKINADTPPQDDIPSFLK